MTTARGRSWSTKMSMAVSRCFRTVRVDWKKKLKCAMGVSFVFRLNLTL